ncbi:bifunctional DNA primase/polymerase [Streptomyces sp. KMM 9044]|uniref:bifunctional DNA primase/polymerase n=1 Tax=Streptomyces sp. KMM 9044 TaxID=2744474 RepID=UPI0021512C03|nr:bifunctional DNA primase/polymerase [Streptomyces sp. KMM 9044]WAX79848.1 bifunctional DNA primase/polymerase [Streptomyces sp. KMM 9044]
MSSARKAPDLSGVTDATDITPDGAAWLASAGTYPRSTLSLWEERPDAPVVLPCGSVFDVVSTPSTLGRRMLDRMWDEGPGSGPVAGFRGRMLLFAAPGTAQRLPALLESEEWDARDRGPGEAGRTGGVPPLLCHGTGDAVTVPAPAPGAGTAGSGSRWLVAPDIRHPWLPGPEVLLWAVVRAARAAVRISIFPPTDQGANVYDVSRRR